MAFDKTKTGGQTGAGRKGVSFTANKRQIPEGMKLDTGVGLPTTGMLTENTDDPNNYTCQELKLEI